MRKTVLYIGVLVGASAALAAAGEVHVHEFMAAALNDPGTVGAMRKIAFLETAETDTPFLDGVEFSAKAGDMRFSEQSCAVKFELKRFSAAARQQKVMQSARNSAAVQYDMALHLALKERYEWLLDWIEKQRLLALKHTLLEILADRVAVLEKLTETFGFDVSKLPDAEYEHMELQLEISDLEQDIRNIKDQFRFYSGISGPVELAAFDMIDVSGVLRTAAGLMGPPDEKNVYLRDIQSDMDAAQDRRRLKQSESGKWLEFVEVEYDHARRDEIENAVSLEVGIRLPGVRTGSDAIRRSALDYIDSKNRFDRTKQALALKRTQLEQALGHLAEQLEAVENLKQSGAAGRFFDITTRMDGANPLTLLDLKQAGVERDIREEMIRARIFQTYLELMDITGALSQKPLVNILTAGREPLAG